MDEDDSTPMQTVSLVVSTLGRGAELHRLLESLAVQDAVGLELIVVDQNEEGDAIAEALTGRWPFPIRHERRPGIRGLSRGRNEGLRFVTTEVVAFPDDDCWYPTDFFARALNLLDEKEADFVSGRPTDESGRTINGRFKTDPQAIDYGNVWTTGIEWLQLFRLEALRSVGGYDETIGIGASTPWQSAEGNDLLLRLLAAGKRGWYDPTLVGHHAELKIDNPDAAMIRKMRGYARGMGHVLRKHRTGPLESAKWLIRPAGGAILSVLRGRWTVAKMYANVAIGRTEGMLGRIIR